MTMHDQKQEAPQQGFLEKVLIYTDGGCKGNPGLGAWAFYVPFEKYSKSGKVEASTNNRMELLACIEALRWVDLNKKEGTVILYTDSQYVQKGITEWIHFWIRNNWVTKAKKQVLNRDLWETLYELQKNIQITWSWVRGHDNNQYNEFCDKLVKQELG